MPFAIPDLTAEDLLALPEATVFTFERNGETKKVTLAVLQEAFGSGGGGGDTEVSAPLTGLDDSRGAKGSWCWDENAGLYYKKVSTTPHTWVAMNASNNNE